MSKHTPGPWKVVSENACREIDVFEIADISHLRVIHATDAWPVAGSPEDDARLIAAAPELLAFAKWFIENRDGPGTSMARAAIEKAEGNK